MKWRQKWLLLSWGNVAPILCPLLPPILLFCLLLFLFLTLPFLFPSYTSTLVEESTAMAKTEMKRKTTEMEKTEG
jgi:hypothetical protein